MSSTQAYCDVEDQVMNLDDRLSSEQTVSDETQTPISVASEMSPENAELSVAIPGLGEQIEDLEEMSVGDVRELLNGIGTWEYLLEMQDEARRRAKLLARLKLADQSMRCAHIKGNNEPCGSPAMKNDTFCYFHSEARKLRDAEQAVAKAMEVPVLDDVHGVQLAIMRVCGLLVGNKIEGDRARAMFEGLRLAQQSVKDQRLKLS